jgi:hypothetical protein
MYFVSINQKAYLWTAKVLLFYEKARFSVHILNVKIASNYHFVMFYRLWPADFLSFCKEKAKISDNSSERLM